MPNSPHHLVPIPRFGAPRAWDLPEGDWVLHVVHEPLGTLTQRWIETQARSQRRLGYRVLGPRPAQGVAHEPHWLDSSQQLRTLLGHRLTYKTRGQSARLIARPLRSKPPAVVHAHFGTDGTMVLPLARALERPLVVSFYGFDATEARIIESPRWRRAYARLFDRAARVLVEGPAMAERVESLGCAAELIEVIRLPADAEALAKVEPQPSEDFTLVAAGRFIEKKGFDTALEAFSRCATAMPDARLRLVGGGELEAELRSKAEALGLGPRVEFTGRLPFDEFMAAVGAADLALYPSRVAGSGDSEGGAPVGLIEAQWLGVPSIVSEHDDLPFVSAPEGSIVLPPRDVDAWASALLELYGDRARLARMSSAASRFARELHAPGATAEQRESAYLRAMPRRSSWSRH